MIYFLSSRSTTLPLLWLVIKITQLMKNLLALLTRTIFFRRINLGIRMPSRRLSNRNVGKALTSPAFRRRVACATETQPANSAILSRPFSGNMELAGPTMVFLNPTAIGYPCLPGSIAGTAGRCRERELAREAFRRPVVLPLGTGETSIQASESYLATAA